MSDFSDIEQELRAQRPEATPLELDRIRQRVASSDAAPKRRRRAVVPRTAFTALVATGALMMGAASTLALSGTHKPVSAAGVEYPTNNVQVLGETTGTTSTPTGTNPVQVLGEQQTPASTVQPTRQAQQPGGGELPFTGLAALPLLVLGAVMLLAGAVLRRRTPART